MSPADTTHRSLRQSLGQFATGVTVVTARGLDGRFVGLTVNSFASVSLDPPLILWSLTADSKLLPAFSACTHFAVNVLSADQADISRRFAGARVDKFSGLDLRVGAGDTPLIVGCCASFECRRETQHDGGDHVIFVGHVERHHRNKEAPAPLLYYGGHYRNLAPQT
ncbi:MAG: flavin reductase family protein [Rhodocyclaceae bacterium]|nr:flavin reductase family protein [Rhodocyclaceae bacterium]